MRFKRHMLKDFLILFKIAYSAQITQITGATPVNYAAQRNQCQICVVVSLDTHVFDSISRKIKSGELIDDAMDLQYGET